MSATSATGVSGAGSAAKPGYGNKGAEGLSMAVHHLIGPRVVMCGDVDLNEAGVATVYYPTLPGTAGLYCVFLQGEDDTTFPVPGSFTTSSFGVTGASGDDVCWQIVKKGIWGSPVSALANT